MADIFKATTQNSKGQNLKFVGAPIRRRLLIQNVAAAGNVAIPQYARITDITVRNQTANAVTGGIKFGTTNGGTDVIAALAVAASVVARDVSVLKTSYAAAGTLYFDAVTAWNSAVVDIIVEWVELPTA